MTEGFGEAFGAVTVVNAIPAWRGAAIGVDLRVEVELRLRQPGDVEVRSTVRGESMRLGGELVEALLRILSDRFGVDAGLEVEIRSEIPVGVGLKSSSAVSNALAAAAADALGMGLDPLEVVRLGVEVSRLAGVTVTGAFDDACASMLGGLCVTDNRRLLLVRRMRVGGGLRAVMGVPREASGPDIARLDSVRDHVEAAYGLALEGDWRPAMLLNGVACASALGYPLEPVRLALQAGAESAGLSGKGPAVAAICQDPDPVAESWGRLGYEVIVAGVR